MSGFALAVEATCPIEVARHLSAAIQSGGLSRSEDELAFENLEKVLRRGVFNPRNATGVFSGHGQIR